METLKMKKKRSRGCKKIEIKKIENEAARQVAFTKRRQGVMKKASELSILCGVDFAVVTFSPAGKPFSFGQPSVDSIVSRFLEHGRVPADDGQQAAVWGLNLHCIEMEQQVEAAMGRRAAAENRLRAAAAVVGEVFGRALEKELRQQDLLFARPISIVADEVMQLEGGLMGSHPFSRISGSF